MLKYKNLNPDKNRDFFMKKSILIFLAKSVGLYINLLSYIRPNQARSLSYALFSQPQKGKLNPNQLPKTLLKAQQEQFQYNQHLFYTHTWKGNEEIILLVHGWESNASRWKKTLTHLKKTGKTIIAIDGPAHGLSNGKEFNVPLYCEFINIVVQKYNPTIAIGHSVGGNALAYFQAQYNHTFEKLVLIGAPSDFNIILRNYVKMLGLNQKVHQLLADYTEARFHINIATFSASKFLENTTIPGLIIHDTHDDVVRIDEAKKIAASWKTAQFIETQGLGHSMHDAELYNKITAFIYN